MKTRIAAIAAAVLIAFGTGCSSLKDPDVSGRVTGKDTDSYKVNKTTTYDYFLTIDGTEYEVTSTTYDRCYHGSAYPACRERADRD